MSIYAYLNCHDCKQSLWLGKALHDGKGTFAFHIGDSSGSKHWDRPELNKIVWKFLADHTGHVIDVRLEHEMTEEMYEYQEIGGETKNDISVNSYLKHNSNFYTK